MRLQRRTLPVACQLTQTRMQLLLHLGPRQGRTAAQLSGDARDGCKALDDLVEGSLLQDQHLLHIEKGGK
jgi:hypothetical protein